MDRLGPDRGESFLQRIPRRVWHIASSVLAVISVLLFVAAVLANLQRSYMVLLLSVGFAAAAFALVFLLSGLSRQLHREQQETISDLQATKHEFQQMADNIQEVFWTIDAETKNAIYVNHAYEAITGRSLRSLRQNPSSYKEVIHPDDRTHVLAKLDEAAQSGHFNEKFRIVRPDGEVRWVWVRGFPVRDPDGRVARLVGTALEITTEKEAEERVDELATSVLKNFQDLDFEAPTSTEISRSIIDIMLVSHESRHLRVMGAEALPSASNGEDFGDAGRIVPHSHQGHLAVIVDKTFRK